MGQATLPGWNKALASRWRERLFGPVQPYRHGISLRENTDGSGTKQILIELGHLVEHLVCLWRQQDAARARGELSVDDEGCVISIIVRSCTHVHDMYMHMYNMLCR